MKIIPATASFPNRCVVICALLLGFTPCVEGQLDFQTLLETATEIASEYELDTDQLSAFSEEDWNQLWSIVHRALQSESLEDLAWVLPHANSALAYLDAIPSARPYADWLRQRIDYLWMAEQVMQEEPTRPVSPPPRPPPVTRPTPVPAPGPVKVTTPPSRPPSPAVRPTANKKAMDSARWVKRIESRPAPHGAAELVPRLKPVFRRHGVPEELVWLAEVESSFDPEARSPVGAMGLYQFMPATAERFGLKLRPDDERKVPERSADAAAQYLKFLHGRFASWPLALAAYNAGEGRVGRLLTSHQATSFEAIANHLPAETRMYVPKIAAVIQVREGRDLNAL